MMSYPIPPTYHIIMDLWQYFGMVSEFPEITGLLRFYPLSVIKLEKRYFYSMKHMFICKIIGEILCNLICEVLPSSKATYSSPYSKTKYVSSAGGHNQLSCLTSR